MYCRQLAIYPLECYGYNDRSLDNRNFLTAHKLSGPTLNPETYRPENALIPSKHNGKNQNK